MRAFRSLLLSVLYLCFALSGIAPSVGQLGRLPDPDQAVATVSATDLEEPLSKGHGGLAFAGRSGRPRPWSQYRHDRGVGDLGSGPEITKPESVVALRLCPGDVPGHKTQGEE